MRPIDVSGASAPSVPPAPGAVPDLRWLSIADLVIDDRFQRPIESHGWAAIKRIASAFSWSKFAPVVASPVIGGRYSLIDGQHRTHAAALCGFDQAPAMVVVLSPEDQAASFAAINGNVTAITAFHVYKAALAAGEAWATRSRDVVAEAGCELMARNGCTARKKPREVYSIQLVRRYVDLGKLDVVRAGLAALAARPAATIDDFSGFVLTPWFAALDEVGPRAIAADLGGFLADASLPRIQSSCVVMAQDHAHRGSTARDLAQRAYVRLLRRYLGDDRLPVPVASSEDGIAARMAEVAQAERSAQRRAGIA